MQKKSKFSMFTFMMLIILGLTFQAAISAYAVCPDDISSYWKMDEAAGPTYSDFIADNDGTGNADPTATAGTVNGAQLFDPAANTGIDVPANRSFNWHGNESFSIEYWVKIITGQPSDNQVVMGRNDPAENGVFWFTGITADGFAIVTLIDTDGVSETLTGTTNLADSAWHHVVVVRDASLGADGTNLLYVDGDLEDSAEVDYTGGFLSNSAELNIGWFDFLTFFRFQGSIDEVALYDRALLQSEIQAHHTDGLAGKDYCAGSPAPPPVSDVPFPDDTISLWRLDEAAGSDYADAFGDNDGTGNADPTAADGTVKGAQLFDPAANTGIDVPADRSFDWLGNESFSIEYWVKIITGQPSDNQVVMGRYDPAENGVFWFTGITADGFAIVTLEDTDNVSETLTGTTNLADSAWHHVVVVRDASLGADGTNLLYVDGDLEDSAEVDYTGGFLSNSAELNIGWFDFLTFFRFQGLLDEIALYDRALPQSEIQAHHNAGLLGIGIGAAAEIIGTWDQGIWYWDVAGLPSNQWTQMTAEVTTGDIAAGDFNGDGIADVASNWDNGLWWQDGTTSTSGATPDPDWQQLDPVPAYSLTAGDVTGDGRVELIGTWDNGIWYWDFVAEEWTQMTAEVTTGDIAAGDFNGDGIADVASSWDNGLWWQDGTTSVLGTPPEWHPLDPVPAYSLTAGDVTGDGRVELIGTWDQGIWYWDFVAEEWTQMTADVTTRDIAAGDFNGDFIADVASSWDNGLWWQDGTTSVLGTPPEWHQLDPVPAYSLTAGDVTGQ